MGAFQIQLPAGAIGARLYLGDRCIGYVETMPPVRQLYRWHWRKRLPERHGQLCEVLARGAMNSILVKFIGDGWTVVTSRFAVRKAK